MEKTALSFYLDDTNPYTAGAKAFETFLNFVSAEGVRGESSVILGYGWEEHGVLSRPRTDDQRAYLAQVRRAYECGVDSHMELMTHWGLFDFAQGRVPEGAQHEGVWLYEPDTPVEAYEAYFRGIIEEGEQVGVRFTGVTCPGCSCEVCQLRFAELRAAGVTGVNPNVWEALLRLAQAGRFRGKAVPCFTLTGPGEHAPVLVASDGDHAVYDLFPNAEDRFGIWDNDPARVSADYYITADGRSGRIVELLDSGAPYCLFYAHWQGLNPVNGVGWGAFQQVVRRVRQFLADRVEWMRPSDYAARCGSAGGGTVQRG